MFRNRITDSPMVTLLTRLVESSIDNGEHRTDLAGVVLCDVTIHGVDLSCCDWAGAELIKVTLVSCDCRGSSFAGAKMKHVRVVECILYDTEFAENLKRVEFENCSFDLTGSRVKATHKPATMEISP
jgi:uncharacterized protein YjbI with pentapeptide repeats